MTDRAFRAQMGREVGNAGATKPTLSGRTALVTGAARGIGAATSRRLAQEGANVVLIDIDGEALDALAAEMGGDDVLPVVADIVEDAEVERAMHEARERFGGR